MAGDFVLDAHALVWFLEGNPRLGLNARAVIQDPGCVLFLPIIALAEACWVVERGRCRIPSVSSLLADVDADSRVVVIPLNRQILDVSLALTSLPEMHDRLIVATALHLSGGRSPLPLVTCDQTITSSALVQVIW